MLRHPPIWFTAKCSLAYTILIGNEFFQIMEPCPDTFPWFPYTHADSTPKPAIPFFKTMLISCQWEIVRPTTNVPLKTLFTILVAPTIATVGQSTYLIFHFCDTLGMQPVLTLSIPTPKGIREELDVTDIGNLGLFLVHFQEQLLLYKGNNVFIGAFCRLPTLAEDNKVISIADIFVTSTFQFLIQFFSMILLKIGLRGPPWGTPSWLGS